MRATCPRACEGVQQQYDIEILGVGQGESAGRFAFAP